MIATSVKEQLLRPIKKPMYPFRPQDFKSTFRQRQRERSKEFKEIAKKAIECKYGKITVGFTGKKRASKNSRSFSTYDGQFGRTTSARKPRADRMFECATIEVGGHVRLDIVELRIRVESTVRLDVSVTGLRKYLPQFDSLTMTASIYDMDSMFQCWKEIEESLISRSNFFTLIDIYGHYANRGDVVDIESSIEAQERSSLVRMIDYFSQTKNCGEIIRETDLCSEMDICDQELHVAIANMRRIRFDIRTSSTHPIIGSGRLLCTYPFPLLSPKALVESRVRFTEERNGRQIETA